MRVAGWDEGCKERRRLLTEGTTIVLMVDVMVVKKVPTRMEYGELQDLGELEMLEAVVDAVVEDSEVAGIELAVWVLWQEEPLECRFMLRTSRLSIFEMAIAEEGGV